MLTTPNLPAFLLAKEGFRPKAYDDKQPWLDLNPGDEHKVKGTITYGGGQTKRADGSPVQLGDTITEQENLDRMVRYIRENIEPALANMIRPGILAGHQYDALGSFLYQYGESEMDDWNLIGLINREAPWQEIVREWISGTVFWLGEPLFWGRRVAEVLMWMGLDWRAGQNVPHTQDIVSVVEMLSPDPLEIPEPPSRKAVIDDLENEVTRSKNLEQLDILVEEAPAPRRKVAITPITPKVPLEAVDYLEDEDKQNVTVKKVRDSQRGKGDIKQAVGEKTFIGAAGASALTIIGAAEPLIRVVDEYPRTSIGTGLVLLMIIGGITVFWGKWQRQKGELEATDVLG